MNQKLVLLVEDHGAVRASVRDWLRTHLPGVELDEAPTGEEALACTTARRPDVVLMDIQLPGITGLEATRRLKAAQPRVPVIILTLHEGEAYRAGAAAAGADAFVLKRRMDRDLLPLLRSLLCDRAPSKKEEQP